MMEKAITNWHTLSDQGILDKLGYFIKQTRIDRDITQTELAKRAGLNRSTISQIERGEAIALLSLIQILRALEALHVLDTFIINDTPSPIELAKLAAAKRQRASKSNSNNTENESEW